MFSHECSYQPAFYLNKMTADQALKEYGPDKCVRAYRLDSDSFSCCYIAVETGIPKHHQSGAILAGEFIANVDQSTEE